MNLINKFLRALHPRKKVVRLTLSIALASHLFYYLAESFYISRSGIKVPGLPGALEVLFELFYGPTWHTFFYHQKVLVFFNTLIFLYITISIVIYNDERLKKLHEKKIKRIIQLTIIYIFLRIILSSLYLSSQVRLASTPALEEIKVESMPLIWNNCLTPFNENCYDCNGIMLPGVCVGMKYFNEASYY